MKRFIVFLVIFATLVSFSGCKEENPYLNNVSELRQNVYLGSAEDYTVTAYFGYRENPFINDGKCGNKVYGYTFKLNIIADEIQRIIEFAENEKTLSATFSCDEVTGEYKAFIETETYFENSFSVNVVCGAETTSVTLNSVLPENCISYTVVLDKLTDTQQSLLNTYAKDGEFNAEIYMRVFVKNDKPYWYIGIAYGNDKIKAFLMDGFSGDLLAIRDIM